jgi:hypothetical protein
VMGISRPDRFRIFARKEPVSFHFQRKAVTRA